ncbi:MAG TPA: cohesin domain-containing protein [Bryobacteraceae bacterium]|nr:cohesin domain-containing protein [Bryobacteraceae bacterium]
MVLWLLPPARLQAHNHKGDKFYKMGVEAENRKDYDKALQYFEAAEKEDPKDAAYELATRRVRFESATAHIETANKLRSAGDLEKALAEYQTAFNTNPGSMIAFQNMQEVKDLLAQKQANPSVAPLTSAEKAQKDSVAMIQSLLPVPELKPVTNVVGALKMNNQPPKVLYETVGKLAGINVLFDPQMQPGKNANLDLNNVSLQEALDYIALLTKTFWKPVSSNAIFVTEDNVTKRRDYEDEVVKVFYLKNPTSTQEFQEIVTAVRSVTDVRRMFQFNAENAVVVRDTVDKVALVEKLLHDLDKPKAEVMVDVIVMDVSSDVSSQIGASLVSGTTNGLVVPFQFSPSNPINTNTGNGASGTGGTGGTNTPGTGTGSGLTGGGQATSSFVALSQLGHIGTKDFSASLPGALLQAVMSDSRTKVQESPQLRVSDGQKASLKIGEKYPYATGSFQPGVGTVGVSPLVSTQFQFVDIGVNVELTPHVHGHNEVTLHLSVDISGIDNTLNLGGLSQPVIGQKKNEADIRLKDGEVSLVGGLMRDQDTSVIGGIPGLVNIPILGKYLFGNTSKDHAREQLMIALIPHIVRKPEISGLDMKAVASGTDATVKLSFAPPGQEAPAASGNGAAPAAAPAATSPAVTPATPGGAPSLAFNPANVRAQLSSQVKVVMQAQNMADLATVPVKVRWDPKVLRLEMISPGALVIEDGKIVAPTLDIRNDTGDATITVNRVAGAGGVTGSGPLLQFTFTAVGKGTTTVSVTEAGLKNASQQPIAVQPPAVSVTVQ